MIAKINLFLQKIAVAIMQFLPDSPFTGFIESIESVPWLGYLNWFVPVGTFVAIGTAWVGAIIVFYVYQMILRWAKVVGD